LSSLRSRGGKSIVIVVKRGAASWDDFSLSPDSEKGAEDGWRGGVGKRIAVTETTGTAQLVI
jgi:hypothetical protein